MKSLNIKKVAAVGAGLALVAASVAAAVPTWSNVADDASKTLKVNGIVYGAGVPDTSDMTAAQALADVIAKYAVTESTATEVITHDKNVCEPTGNATFTAESGKEKKVELSSATEFDGTAMGKNNGSGKLDNFIDESKTFKYEGDDLTVTFKETMVLTSDVSYDDDEDIQMLVAEVSEESLKYNVALTGDDLGFGKDSKWSDSSNDAVMIPFLGEWYSLDKVNVGDPQLDLLKTSASDPWYDEGQEIKGLLGRDGKLYTLKFTEGYTSGEVDYATLELYDESGKLVSSEDVEEDSDVTFFFESGENNGDEVLADSVYVVAVSTKTVDNTDTYRAKIRTGSNRVVLKNSYCYPDYTESDLEECNWSAFVTFTDSNTLSAYGIQNTEANEYLTGDNPLEAGDSLVFPENFGAVQFVGFDDEDTGLVQIGVELDRGSHGSVSSDASSTGVKFKDTDGTIHQVPFYYDLGEKTLNGGAGDDADYAGWTVRFDSTNYVLAVREDDQEQGKPDVAFEEGTYNSASKESYAYTEIANLAEGIDATKTLNFDGQNDITVPYIIAYSKDGTKYHFWLILKAGDLTEDVQSDAEVYFRGTTFEESEDFNTVSSDYNAWYVFKDKDFADLLATYDVDNFKDSELFYTAIFDVSIDSNGTFSEDAPVVRAFIDTKTGQLTDEDDTDNGLSWTAAEGDYGAGDATFTAGNELYIESGELKQYISDFGTIIKVVDDDYLEVVVPESQLKVQYNFYQGDAILSADETCTVETVTENVDKTVKTLWTGVEGLVMQETAGMTGNYIVVGGYMVNNLFAAEPTVSAALTAENTKVVDVVNDSIYIAGWTAADTMEAVDEVIALLESEKEVEGEQ